MEKKIYVCPDAMIVTNEDLMQTSLTDGGFGSAGATAAKTFDIDFSFFDETIESESQEETLESFVKKAHYNVWEEEF
jgi:hypothetical protein